MLSADAAAWIRDNAWTPGLRTNPPDDLCPCQHRLMGGCEYRHDTCPGVTRRPRPRTHLVGPDGRWRHWPPGLGPMNSVGWGSAAGRGPVRVHDSGCVWVCQCGCHQGLISQNPPPWAVPPRPVQPELF